MVTVGLALIGLFDVTLQYLRAYALSHTTSRIDVELGGRLFDHLLRLPLAYFETRPAGQTVARMRELETVRAFLTGQGLTSAIDFLFTGVFIAVLFAYSVMLTLIVLISIPVYLAIAIVIRPTPAREDQPAIQYRRRQPAVPGGSDRRHSHPQVRRHRADPAQPVGGKARGLCEDLVSGGEALAASGRTSSNT